MKETDSHNNHDMFQLCSVGQCKFIEMFVCPMRNCKSFYKNFEKQFIFSCTILTDSEKHIGKTPVCLEQHTILINEIINEMLFINFCKYSEISLQ